MRLLFEKRSRSAALAAVFLSFLSLPLAAQERLPAALDAQATFEQLNQLESGKVRPAEGERLVFEIDLATSPGFSIEAVNGGQEARYRMAFNNIAEGWSWQPLADPRQEDYYRAKFLPLQSVLVERGQYDQEEKIGEMQRTRILWRYDYFLAFENLYDFYPRQVDDDAGFVAKLPVGTVKELSEVGMRAIARLREPFVSESTTFWKAVYSKPTDFTLKKRYVFGELEAVVFYDKATGEVLGRAGRPSENNPERVK